MAHGDDRGMVVRNRLNDKREALIGVGMSESGAYSCPNKSIRMPDPIWVSRRVVMGMNGGYLSCPLAQAKEWALLTNLRVRKQICEPKH